MNTTQSLQGSYTCSSRPKIDKEPSRHALVGDHYLSSVTGEEDGRKRLRELRVYESTLELLRGMWPTPLVKLRSFGEVWAKLEFFNAVSRSIKDRTAVHIIETVSKMGVKKIVDATSGNFGIALTLLANLLGLKVTVAIPRRTSREVEHLLRLLGAEVVRAPCEVNDHVMVSYCKKLAESIEAFFTNQFESELNPEAHYMYTGRELAEQLRAANVRPDVLVVALGTGGHAAGIARALRESFGDLYVVGVASSRLDYIPGIKPGDTYRKWRDSVNEVVEVSLRDAARGVIEVARREGLLVGLSSGAVVSALEHHVKPRLGADKVYVLVFPDDAQKYLSVLCEVAFS